MKQSPFKIVRCAVVAAWVLPATIAFLFLQRQASGTNSPTVCQYFASTPPDGCKDAHFHKLPRGVNSFVWFYCADCETPCPAHDVVEGRLPDECSGVTLSNGGTDCKVCE
jgi:hypothetical protein